MHKIKVLIFIDWFYPAFKAGGPIRSVFNIVNSLHQNIDFYIVTSLYDLNEKIPLEGITKNVWLKNDIFSIIYLENKQQNKKFYLDIIKSINPDKIYFNSLFSKKFTILPLQLIKDKSKVILAPRGMLGAEALKIKSKKKKIFIKIFKSLKIFNNIVWHASTILEEQEIKLAFGNDLKVIVAQNITSSTIPRPLAKQFKRKGELRLIFFSRINEKKNLLFALEALKTVNNKNVKLDFYGPIEDEKYYNEAINLIVKHSLNAEYKGILLPNELPNKIWDYHYLLFPTKHENYGHVIVESLCASLPVILSKNTPWLDLESKQIGYDLELNIQKFSQLIAQLIIQNQEDYTILVNSAYSFSQENILNPKIKKQNERLFINEQS